MMIHGAASPGAGQFLGVDWGSIALVCVAALIAGVVIVTLYSLGLRLLAVGSPDEITDASETGGTGAAAAALPRTATTRATHARPAIATFGAVVCIGVSILAVLYGIYLVIPLFH